MPVVSNYGIGDTDVLLENEKVGAVVRDFTAADYLASLQKIDELTKRENFVKYCRDVASKHFDLQKIGGERYRGIYRRLLSDKV